MPVGVQEAIDLLGHALARRGSLLKRDLVAGVQEEYAEALGRLRGSSYAAPKRSAERGRTSPLSYAMLTS